jgi:glutamate racemase
VPQSVSLVDTGAAVARHLQSLLAQRQLLAAGPAHSTRLWCSGDVRAMQAVLPKLLVELAAVQALPV